MSATGRTIGRCLPCFLDHDHYNRQRPHQALGLAPPDPPGELIAFPHTTLVHVRRRDRLGAAARVPACIVTTRLCALRVVASYLARKCLGLCPRGLRESVLLMRAFLSGWGCHADAVWRSGGELPRAVTRFDRPAESLSAVRPAAWPRSGFAYGNLV